MLLLFQIIFFWKEKNYIMREKLSSWKSIEHFTKEFKKHRSTDFFHETKIELNLTLFLSTFNIYE